LTLLCDFSLSYIRPPPTSTLFPYTTLFRSKPAQPKSEQSKSGQGKSRSGPRSKTRHQGGRQASSQGSSGANAARNSSSRRRRRRDRKSTRLNSSHVSISYAVFCLKKKISQP